MGRFNPKWNAAEKASLEMVPETCDTIERAMDEAFKCPNFQDDEINAVLKKYGIEPNKDLGHALHEIVSPMLFGRKMKLLDVVKYEGTFPLRQALIQQISWNQSPYGPHPQNYVDRWIRDWNMQQKLRSTGVIQQAA